MNRIVDPTEKGAKIELYPVSKNDSDIKKLKINKNQLTRQSDSNCISNNSI